MKHLLCLSKMKTLLAIAILIALVQVRVEGFSIQSKTTEIPLDMMVSIGVQTSGYSNTDDILFKTYINDVFKVQRISKSGFAFLLHNAYTEDFNSLVLAPPAYPPNFKIYYAKRSSADESFAGLIQLYEFLGNQTHSASCTGLAINNDGNSLAISVSKGLKVAPYTVTSELYYLEIEGSGSASTVKNVQKVFGQQVAATIVRLADNYLTYKISSTMYLIDLNDPTLTPKNIMSVGIYSPTSRIANGFKIATYFSVNGGSNIKIYDSQTDSFQELTVSSSLSGIGLSYDGNYAYIKDSNGVQAIKIIPQGSSFRLELSNIILGTPFQMIDGTNYKKVFKIDEVSNYIVDAFDFQLYFGNYQTAPSRDCSGDIASTKKFTSNLQCQCLLHHSWDPTLEKCVANCKTRFAMGPKTSNPLQCQCEAKAIWEDKSKLCLLDCPNILYSTGQLIGDQICECSEASEWNPRTLSCDPKCDSLESSTGNIVDGVCECLENFFWDSRKGVCERDCSVDPRAIYGKATQDGSCVCETGYVWAAGACTLLSCNSIAYVDQTATHPADSCICQAQFDWDSSRDQCVLNCSKITGNLHLNQNIDVHSCRCSVEAAWNQPALTCFLNCSIIDNALPVNVNAEECSCQAGFSWNTGQCVTNCGKNVGEDNVFDDSEGRCACLAGFQYYYNSPEGGACYRSCSSIPNTEGYFGKNPNSCTCAIGYIWNEVTDVCQLSCEGPYDQALSGTTCTCIGSAVFISAVGKCMPICSIDSLSTGSFNYDSFGCFCKTNAHWDKSVAECACNSGYIQNVPLKKCELQASGASAIPIAIGSAVCSGGAVFVGMLIQRRRKEQTQDEKNTNDDPVSIQKMGAVKSEQL